jgi:hypothetical protein
MKVSGGTRLSFNSEDTGDMILRNGDRSMMFSLLRGVIFQKTELFTIHK